MALGVTLGGEKVILGSVETRTENAKVCTTFLRSLEERRHSISGDGLLVVIDGGKGLHAAVEAVFGEAGRSTAERRSSDRKRRTLYLFEANHSLRYLFLHRASGRLRAADLRDGDGDSRMSGAHRALVDQRLGFEEPRRRSRGDAHPSSPGAVRRARDQFQDDELHRVDELARRGAHGEGGLPEEQRPEAALAGNRASGHRSTAPAREGLPIPPGASPRIAVGHEATREGGCIVRTT